jgi:hypothetical protein
MPILASREAVAATRRPIVSNGVGAHPTTYIGMNRYNRAADAPPPPRPEAVCPMAFLVEQPPGSVVDAHFHEANQFQLVVAGGGLLGRHEVGPIAVHYSNAYSAYGPLAAGPEGLWYFTLRNGYDRGAQYLPGARAVVKDARRRFRQATAGPVPPVAAEDEEVLLPEAADGIGAWRHRVAPGGTVVGPDPARGDGQFWVVTAGRLSAAGVEAALPPLSCVFVAPDEPAFTAAADAEEGLEVVVMQFPRGRDHVAPEAWQENGRVHP